MRIAIFDDNERERLALYQFISDWCKNISPAVTTIHQFDSVEKLQDELFEAHFYNLYFLDIMTDKANDAGFRLAEEIRQRDIRAIIIFTTNSPEYMSSAFEISAYRYLVKPIPQKKIADILENTYKLLSTQKTKAGEFQGLNEKLIIPYADITHIESFAFHHKARVYMTNGQTKDISLAGTTFAAFADKQLTADFFHCHRGYIINMCHITGYGKDFVTLCDSITVPIGRDKKNDFINFLLTYHKGLL